MIRRWLFRVPLVLHRAGVRGLERIVGIDWIVLETIGRRSGRTHTVVLDVVGEAPGVWYVQPAYGRNAAWVRNVDAEPLAWAAVHGRRLRVYVTDVTGPEGADVVLRFVRAHQWYARMIVWFVGYVDSIDHPDDALRQRLLTTPVRAIRAL
ncbi:MAG TPA: nitroreductase family deazaflavin-dependent oxidoreductase [Candidatus Binatia bacterium]|nr:nitroreductase family deazaflavin-dependent oxidoreductase [Candidatus Binatia bacterium]